MTPDQRGIGWWQKIRRAVTGLGVGMAPADPSVAAPVSWIEPGGLAERLANGAAPIIVDVRGADEFNGKLGHLADALTKHRLPELPGRIAELAQFKDRDLVLVRHIQMRSAQAAQLLNAAGFGNVAVLRGGMVEWRRRGLSVAGAGFTSGA